MSDYQTEDGQPKYGVRLNPEELAVLREKQAREAEREREAKARRLAERRAKRRAAKRDFAAAEAEYVRRAREREREREAEHEGHFEHESLAGPEGLSDHEAGHGHEGQAAHEVRADHESQAGREGRSDHVYDRYGNITGSYSYWSDDKDRADHEGRKFLVVRGRALQAARLSVRAITLLTTTTKHLGTTAWLPGVVLSTGLYPVRRSNAAAGVCLLSACS